MNDKVNYKGCLTKTIFVSKIKHRLISHKHSKCITYYSIQKYAYNKDASSSVLDASSFNKK